jgi:hypothetical protein
MINADPDNDSTVEQLLGAIAILALLAVLFAWGAYVSRSDDRARRELAAEQCGAANAAYVSVDDGRIVCLGGSGRVRR